MIFARPPPPITAPTPRNMAPSNRLPAEVALSAVPDVEAANSSPPEVADRPPRKAVRTSVAHALGPEDESKQIIATIQVR